MTRAMMDDLWDRDIACPDCGHGLEQYHAGTWIEPGFNGCEHTECACKTTPNTIIRELRQQLANLQKETA